MCSQRISETYEDIIKTINLRIGQLGEEKNKLNDRLARFDQFYSEGKFTKEEFNEKTKKVVAQIPKLKRKSRQQRQN